MSHEPGAPGHLPLLQRPGRAHLLTCPIAIGPLQLVVSSMPYPMPSSAPSPISPLQCTCSSPPDEPPLPPLRAQARRPSTRHRMLHQKHLKSAGGSMRVRSKAELMEALNEVPRGGGEGGGQEKRAFG